MSLSLADHGDFDSMAELTVAGWAYFNATGSQETLAAKYSSIFGSIGQSWSVVKGGSEEIRFFTRTGGSFNNLGTSNSIIAVDGWYYIVCTYDGATKKIYVNGVLAASVAKSGTIDASTVTLHVGATQNEATVENYMDGRIGGVSISATTMTEREIKAEYQRGLRRINSTIDTNDTISDNDVAAIASDPIGKYVAVMGDDKAVYTFDEFAVPVASDTYPGTTGRDIAIKSMPGGGDPFLMMAGSDQLEIVQPNPRAF